MLRSGIVRLLQQLAADASEDSGLTYQRLAAELQHVVLSATAAMLQAARGQPPTSWVDLLGTLF